MGKFNAQDMENHQIGGTTFGFSGMKVGRHTLGASEYTLGTIVVDGSGSVTPFWPGILKAIQFVVKASRSNPRADNMMLRVVVFDNTVQEVHGFKLLMDCNEDDYANLPQPGGSTALYDASYTAIKAVTDYGKQLTAADYTVNGFVCVITDGANCAGKCTPQMVADALTEAKTSEALESIMPLLVGVNTYGGLTGYLSDFQRDAGFQQYVDIDKADDQSLAKMAGWLSKSYSSQSQKLGSGGPSQSLSFN